MAPRASGDSGGTAPSRPEETNGRTLGGSSLSGEAMAGAVIMSKSIQELSHDLLIHSDSDGPNQSVVSALCLLQKHEVAAGLKNGAACPFLSNQNVLTSSALSTVMENSAASSADSSPLNSVFCSKYETHTNSEKKPEEHVESILEEYSQEGRDVQKRLSEVSCKFGISVGFERHIPSPRQKESQSQENVEIQLKNTIQELEAANQLQEELLREADGQTERLRGMVHSHEAVLLELRGIPMDYEGSTGGKLCEHENVPHLHIHGPSAAFADLLRDLDAEVSHLKEKVVLVEKELQALKKDAQTPNQLLLQQHQNRKQRRNQHSVHVHEVSRLEPTVSQLRSQLREAKRMHEDKVRDLEKQLHRSHSERAEAQTEQDQRSQESENLSDRIRRLLAELHKKEIELSLEKEQNKRLWDRNTENSVTIDHLQRELANNNKQLQLMEDTVKEARAECHRQMERQMVAIKEKNEDVGRISSLTVQLESTKETLRKVTEDLTAKRADLETAEETVSNLRACLREKERALEVTDEEIKRLRSQLGSRMQELQHVWNGEDRLHGVQSERETLKLQVLEKERIVEIFQKQIDTMAQVVGQHGRTAGAMEVEKSQLRKEINDWKVQVEELKIARDEKGARIREVETRLNELELEKVKLVNTCTERLRALDDMKLEKDQLMNEVQASWSELAGLAEGFEDLKREYQDKIREMENTANRLKMRLKSAQAELEQSRTALKTMEGSDGNAVKVAVGMQKKITAKRGQIDALQSKIKFLEEAMTNAAKEKHYLGEENRKLSQELSCVTAENAKITGEMDILRSQDKSLKDKISKMEAALDKASLQFAECQCMIQRQEQELMRFRLQHTLDVKELQGPGYSSAPGKLRHIVPLAHPQSAVLPPSLNLATSAPQMTSKPGISKEEPLQDLKRILQELTSSGSDIPPADLGKDGSNGGKKSPLATMRNTGEISARDPATESIVEKAALGWDPSCLHTADLPSRDVTLPFTSLGGVSVCSAAPRCTSSPKKVSQERCRERSPVDVLLTSPPGDLAAGPSASPGHRPAAKKVGSPEAAATAHQITSQSMETSENTPRRLQNKMESLQNLVESLQIKNQAMSSKIRTRERKMEKAKGKERKLQK